MKFSFPGLSDQEVSESRQTNGAKCSDNAGIRGFLRKVAD